MKRAMLEYGAGLLAGFAILLVAFGVVFLIGALANVVERAMS